MTKKIAQTLPFIFVLTLISGLIACTSSTPELSSGHTKATLPSQVLTQESVDEQASHETEPPVKLTTLTSTQTPTATPTATEVVEEFDESALDLLNWGNWELVEKEELPESEKVRLLEGGKLFAFPYIKEIFTDFSHLNPAIREIDFNTDLDVEIAEIRKVKNEKGGTSYRYVI